MVITHIFASIFVYTNANPYAHIYADGSFTVVRRVVWWGGALMSCIRMFINY